MELRARKKGPHSQDTSNSHPNSSSNSPNHLSTQSPSEDYSDGSTGSSSNRASAAVDLRVTRAQTRQVGRNSTGSVAAASSSASTPTPAPAAAPAPAVAPSPVGRKRKARNSSVHEDEAEVEAEAGRTTRKRAKPTTTPSTPKGRRSAAKGNTRKPNGSMADSGAGPSGDHAEQPTSDTPAPSSSKRKSTKKPKPAAPAQTPSTGKAKPRRRNATNPPPPPAAASSEPPPPPPAPDGDQDEDMEDMPDRPEDEQEEDYDHDDDDDDDGYDGGYIGSSGAINTLRALTGMMTGISSRLREILTNLKKKEEPSIQLIALQELAEILLVSTEDNLSGHFSPDQFIKELVSLMRDPGPFGEENPEMMLLACRCIANLMEALPAATANVVYGGAVPVLCAKLLEIQYIDLAEQALSTLEKISVDYPTSIVREGGLTACLTYLDFFATNVQRTAVITAANCCRNIPDDSFNTVRDVMPVLLGVLGSSDQKVLENACLCVARIVESFRHQPDKLEELISKDMLKTVITLLLPASTNLVGPHIHTQFLKVLSIIARASPMLSAEMFKMKIVDTLYQILTGISPPEEVEGVPLKIDSVMIMQALIHRPREQVFETLNVVCELLPGLPADDELFDVQPLVPYGFVGATKAAQTELNEKRKESLQECRDELKRFAVVLLPTLVDAYSSTVNLSVRQKVLTAQLKMFTSLDSDILKLALSNVQFSSYLATILSQKDNPTLVVAAMQASEMLLRRLPDIYEYQFHREGVVSEIKKIADASPPAVLIDPPITPVVEDNQDDVRSESSHGSDAHSESSDSSDDIPAISPDQNIEAWIAGRAQKFMEKEHNRGTTAAQQAAAILTEIRGLTDDLKKPNSDAELVFECLAKYFNSEGTLSSISSFELLNSDIVNVMVDCLSNGDESQLSQIRSSFLKVFMRSPNGNLDNPFSVLVQKLQDLLSRAEHFEVITVSHNAFDANKSSPASMLAKQIRLKLVADDSSEIPKSYRNIMVSIHAIATFKALDDYLRPRITMSEIPKSRREGGLSSALAAFAAAAGLHPSAPSSLAAAAARNQAAGEGTSSAAPPKPSKSSRRRSARHQKDRNTDSTGSSPKLPPMNLREGEQVDNQLECMDEQQLDQDMDEDEMDLDEMNALMEDLDRDLSDDGEQEISAVNMEVAPGGKVTARKDDGTKVATPNNNSKSSLAIAASGRPSYAAALKSRSTDWHIEFSIGDKVIGNDMTIYKAVHLKRTDNEPLISPRNLWNSIYPVKFRRVAGPAPAETLETKPTESEVDENGVPSSISKNQVTSSILHLLSILHALNLNLDDVVGDDGFTSRVQKQALSQFVNTKLTAKINRQLEEPLIVASQCLPAWSEDLARLYPFLFPFETRHLFLQSTSFGYSRSMTRWQNAQATSDTRHDRRDDGRPFLGRLQRQKVRIARPKMLESAMKVMELYGSSPSILEVEYFGEVGTGLGPTLEFYSTVSREFASKKLKLWRESDSENSQEYAFGDKGLFPAPMSNKTADNDNGQKVLNLFKILGKFVARSMLDSRIIDISFNPTFFRIGEGNNAVAPSLGAVKSVDQSLARSLKLLKKFASAKAAIDAQVNLSEDEKFVRATHIEIDGAHVEDLGLDFTLPGFPDIELVEDGANKTVDIYSVGEYVERVIDLTLGSGVKRQAEAFKTGFSQVFPYTALRAFTPDELVMLFGQNKEDWSIETLMDSIKADHGFNMDSKSVRNLLQAMAELKIPQRRDFLQFVTGSPKLPIGGFKNLNPNFTVVCKPSEAPFTSDDYLPSVMTCVNYLKLPDYTTLEILKSRLAVAIREGQGAFHLS